MGNHQTQEHHEGTAQGFREGRDEDALPRFPQGFLIEGLPNREGDEA
jgi:hypothetical protein